ncbi:MAG: hypothetical protein KF745_01250 [Phycisphaeraceae bacterium]|nr:hypothetical protein [Phycisphaeraceae bacterium]
MAQAMTQPTTSGKARRARIAYRSPASTASLIAALACTFLAAAPATAQWDQAAVWAGKKLLELRQAHLPQQPRFDDAIAADSPNAAGRYLWLFERLDPRLSSAAGSFELNLSGLRVSEYLSAVTTDEMQKLLEDNQAWILTAIEATRIESFNLHKSALLNAAPPREGDPRRGFLTKARRCQRVLGDDAIRLWCSGDYAGAIERASAIVRLGIQLRPRHADITDALVAEATIAHGTRLLQEMHAAAAAQSLDLAIFDPAREAIGRVNADDPGGIRDSWFEYRRGILEFAEAQLSDENPGTDLAIALAQVTAQRIVIARVFEPLHEAMNEGKPPIEPVQEAISLRSPKTRQQLSDAARKLSGMSVIELLDRVDAASVLGAELESNWDADNSDDLFRTADIRIEADRTGMLTLLLGAPRSLHRKWKESVQQHQRLQQMLQPLPAPDAPPAP